MGVRRAEEAVGREERQAASELGTGLLGPFALPVLTPPGFVQQGTVEHCAYALSGSKLCVVALLISSLPQPVHSPSLILSIKANSMVPMPSDRDGESYYSY